MRRPAVNARKGSLLIVALMVVLVMAGLAAVGARGVMMELSQVGNFRTAEQSARVTESGMEGTIAVAIEKGDAFPAYLQETQYQLAPKDVSQSFYDMTTAGSFGREAAVLKDVTFVTKASLPMDTNRVPGYPVNDQFVWKRFQIQTYGYYGSADSGAATTADILRNSSRQYVSLSYVGPYIVGGGGQ